MKKAPKSQTDAVCIAGSIVKKLPCSDVAKQMSMSRHFTQYLLKKITGTTIKELECEII